MDFTDFLSVDLVQITFKIFGKKYMGQPIDVPLFADKAAPNAQQILEQPYPASGFLPSFTDASLLECFTRFSCAGWRSEKTGRIPMLGIKNKMAAFCYKDSNVMGAPMSL